MERGIGFTQLPKTFQDAMIMTRYLGINYIWIDSLCIIQDSVEDWEKESALMDQIYSNSSCNIAAAGASDSYQGLFFDRDTCFQRLLKVETGKSVCYVLNQSLWVSGVEQSRISRRAWVCQERLLSPRNLHFGTDQVFWECNEHSACEFYPSGFPSSILTTKSKRMNPSVDGPLLREAAILPPDPSLNAYTVWTSIVYMYTYGRLSRESDKLVAISGLAATLQTCIGGEYLAGLWKKHLAGQLLWCVGATVQSTRPQSYVAPSWSWASVIGHIGGAGAVYYADERDISIMILETNVDLVSSSPFGQVKGGYIKLKGRLARAAVRHDATSYYDGKLALYVDCLVGVDIMVRRDIHVSDDQWIYNEYHDNLYCLPISSSSDTSLRIGGEVSQRGLLLQPTGGDVVGEFSRFGWFDAYGSAELAWLEEAYHHFDLMTENMDSTVYDGPKEDHEFIITII